MDFDAILEGARTPEDEGESIRELLSGSKDAASKFAGRTRRSKSSAFSAAGTDPLDLLSMEVTERHAPAPEQPEMDDDEMMFQLELQKELGMALGEPEPRDPDPPRERAPSPPGSDGSLDDIMGDILDIPKPKSVAAREAPVTKPPAVDEVRNVPSLDVELVAKPKRRLGAPKAKPKPEPQPQAAPGEAGEDDHQERGGSFHARRAEQDTPTSELADGRVAPALAEPVRSVSEVAGVSELVDVALQAKPKRRLGKAKAKATAPAGSGPTEMAQRRPSEVILSQADEYPTPPVSQQQHAQVGVEQSPISGVPESAPGAGRTCVERAVSASVAAPGAMSRVGSRRSLARSQAQESGGDLGPTSSARPEGVIEGTPAAVLRKNSRARAAGSDAPRSGTSPSTFLRLEGGLEAMIAVHSGMGSQASTLQAGRSGATQMGSAREHADVQSESFASPARASVLVSARHAEAEPWQGDPSKPSLAPTSAPVPEGASSDWVSGGGRPPGTSFHTLAATQSSFASPSEGQNSVRPAIVEFTSAREDKDEQSSADLRGTSLNAAASQQPCARSPSRDFPEDSGTPPEHPSTASRVELESPRRPSPPVTSRDSLAPSSPDAAGAQRNPTFHAAPSVHQAAPLAPDGVGEHAQALLSPHQPHESMSMTAQPPEAQGKGATRPCWPRTELVVPGSVRPRAASPASPALPSPTESSEKGAPLVAPRNTERTESFSLRQPEVQKASTDDLRPSSKVAEAHAAGPAHDPLPAPASAARATHPAREPFAVHDVPRKTFTQAEPPETFDGQLGVPFNESSPSECGSASAPKKSGVPVSAHGVFPPSEDQQVHAARPRVSDMVAGGPHGSDVGESPARYRAHVSSHCLRTRASSRGTSDAESRYRDDVDGAIRGGAMTLRAPRRSSGSKDSRGLRARRSMCQADLDELSCESALPRKSRDRSERRERSQHIRRRGRHRDPEDLVDAISVGSRSQASSSRAPDVNLCQDAIWVRCSTPPPAPPTPPMSRMNMKSGRAKRGDRRAAPSTSDTSDSSHLFLVASEGLGQMRGLPLVYDERASSESKHTAHASVPDTLEPPMIDVVDSTHLRVSWTPKDPAVSFAVAVHDGTLKFYDARSKSLVGEKSLAPPLPNVSSVVFAGTVGRTYVAAVAALNRAGWSAYATSNEVLMQVPAVLPRPSVEPIDATTVRVTWEPLEEVIPVTGFGISVAIQDGSQQYYDARIGMLVADAKDAGAVSPEATSVTVQGLCAGTKYKARVAAKNKVGWSKYSPFSTGAMITVPAVPEQPEISIVSKTSVSVSWTKSTCLPEVDGYSVVVQDEMLKYFDLRSGELTTAPEHLAPIPGAWTSVVVESQLGRTYRAKVAAKNVVGWSPYSSFCDLVKIEEPHVPLQPVLDVIDSTTIRVAWTAAPATSSAIGYAIAVEDVIVKYYDPDTECLTADAGDLRPVGPDVSSVAIQGLRSHAPYRAKVAVGNNVGWSKYSPFSERVVIAKPSPPQPDVRVISSSSIRVSWKPSQSRPKVTGYIVGVCEGDEGDEGSVRYFDSVSAQLVSRLADAEPVSSCSMAVLIRSLLPNVSYKVKVAALNDVGLGNFSSQSGVMLAETDDMRMWPPLQRDLAPKVDRPRTYESSLFKACLERDRDGSVASALRSLGHDVLERFRGYLRAGLSEAQAAMAVWIGKGVTDSSYVFVQLNRVILGDSEVQLWSGVIRLLCAQLLRAEGPGTLTVWRGSKLTRRQVDDLRSGEVIRPPMFVSTSTSMHVAEVFRDTYIVRMRLPSRHSVIMREASGPGEVVLPPYTPIRIISVESELIEAEVTREPSVPLRAFPI